MTAIDTTAPAKALPRWDLTTIFPSLESPEYHAAVADLEAQIEALTGRFDAAGVRRIDATPEATSALASTTLGLLEALGAVKNLYSTLESFCYGFFSTDTTDAVAQRALSTLEQTETSLKSLSVRLRGWLGSLRASIGSLIALEPGLEIYRFFLEHEAEESSHLMSEELEALAAELVIDGANAFGRLQGQVTSQIKVAFELDGVTEERPITAIRNLSNHADGAVRERAYRAELAGWETVKTSVAASLNAVKGTSITLAKRRGYESVLEEAVRANRIDKETLEALMGAIEEHFPTFRRYLNSKAKKLGKAQLAWWDLTAPVGDANTNYDWAAARSFIIEKFSTFSEGMGAYAKRAFDENWIDAGPREGKVGGAFCMPILGKDESRILANFDGSFDQVSTLAHELGHGFHNDCQNGLETLRRGAPATLAETASIFCETLVAEAALETASDAEKLTILEAQLTGATGVCLDISSRFRFESAVFAGRAKGVITADELSALMTKAQGETYADAVDPETYHPFMWLWKPHYYSFDYNFYNFPYAFGHLFGLGLYAIYKREGESFIERYRTLLRSTGEGYAAPLAEAFGLNIRERDFWRASLEVVEAQVTRYEAL